MERAQDTTAANLFAAAKSYFMAARLLLVSMEGVTAASAIPFYFLSGFAIELALKAVVLRVNADQRELRSIGHDLRKALNAAETCGLSELDPGMFSMIARMSESHAGLAFRYIPDVEVMDMIGPGLLDALLARLILTIESEFDVWEDHPANQPKL